MSEEGGADTGTTTENATSEQKPEAGKGKSESPSDDGAAQRLADLERQLEEWKGHARKHEDRNRELSKQLKGSKTEQDRLAELEQAVAAAEQDRNQERAFSALTQVQLRLAEAGVKSEDVAGVLEQLDASSLLKDGKPNGAAIEKFANSLIKVATRATPDPDQGRKGPTGPVDMNTLIRRAAGVQI